MKIKVLISVIAITLLTFIFYFVSPVSNVMAKGGSLMKMFQSGGPCTNMSYADGYPALFTCIGQFGSASSMSLPLPRVNGLRPFYMFAGMPGAVAFDWDPASWSVQNDAKGSVSETCSDLPDEGNERLIGTYVNTKIEMINPSGGSNVDGRSFNIQKGGGGEMAWGINSAGYPGAFSTINTVQSQGWTSENIFPNSQWGIYAGKWQGPGGEAKLENVLVDDNKYTHVNGQPDFIFLSSPTSSLTFGGSSAYHRGEPGITLKVNNEYILYARKGVTQYDTCNKYCKRHNCHMQTDPITGETKEVCNCAEEGVRWEGAGGYLSPWFGVGSALTTKTRYFGANVDPVIPIFQSQPILVSPN